MIIPTGLLLLAALHGSSNHHGPGSPTRAKGSLVGLFSSDDYPNLALAKNEEGTVSVRLTIGSDGRVSNCKVRMSSMSENLDVATCRILTARAQFEPARDRAGRPVSDYYRQRIIWKIPRGNDRVPFADMRAVTTMTVPLNGLSRCAFSANDQKADVPDLICAEMVKRALYDLSTVPLARTRPITIITSEELLVGDSLPAVAPAAFVRRRAAHLRIDAEGAVVGCQPMTEADLGGGDGTTLCSRADERQFEPLSPTEPNRTERLMVVVGTTRLINAK